MSSAQSSTEYEKYYVPESSSLAVRATIGLVLTVFGGGLVLNEMNLRRYSRYRRYSQVRFVRWACDVYRDTHLLVPHSDHRKQSGHEQCSAEPQLRAGHVLVHFL